MEMFLLYISYPGGVSEEFDNQMDQFIEQRGGRRCSSGAGLGRRDLEYDFHNNERLAQKAKEDIFQRIKEHGLEDADIQVSVDKYTNDD